MCSGLAMKRLLSHIVLFALLVISPVSFSTTEIPNFYILVTINAPLKESRKAGITVAHRVGKSLSSAVVDCPPEKCIISLPILPAIDSTHEIEHGRAPPVVPTV